jgi:undecaprenyl-diphosphatase
MSKRALLLRLSGLLLAALLLVAAIITLLPMDQALAAGLQHLTDPALSAVLTHISIFGEAPIEAMLVGLAVAAFAWRRRWLEAWFVVVAPVSAGALVAVIKMLVGRPRPVLEASGSLFWRLFDHYSFPSGHAAFYTAFFGAVAFLLWQRCAGRARWAGIVLCLTLIVLVGPSRVFLGAHWPSDVLAGYLVGGVCLSAAVLLFQWRYEW